jgi:diguanylate cyclase (GGDEF)-like protein
LDSFLDQQSLMMIALGAVLGVFCGLILARLGQGRSRAELQQLRAELSRAEAQTREQSRQASRMRSEQRTFASFVGQLPSAVQQLNRDNLDPRQIPKLILQLADSIFEPEQALVYLAGPQGDRTGLARQLYLTAEKGVSVKSGEITTVRFGEGKIGWAAEHQMEMTLEDWLNPNRTEGRQPLSNHPGLKLDLIGPFVHHGDKGAETLGVLCLGGVVSRLRNEKIMLQMVTNLGSIAIVHARNLRSLRDQAHHDGLTGLMNKRKFMERIGLMINDAEGGGQSLGLFIFDIDFFKRYNDTNGHPAGDELLKDIAQVIRSSLRQGDVACRYGGEEFVVAMPDTDGETSWRAAERIRQTIEQHRFAHEDSQPNCTLTISGGVASFPVDGATSTELLNHADQALYRAKAAGRNRVIRFQGVDIGDTGRDDEDGIDDSGYNPYSNGNLALDQ